MTEHELRQWREYAARFLLPTRRIQMQLAQIALLIAVCMGGAKDAKLQDFLFDPPPKPTKKQKQQLADAIEFFKFAPRNNGKVTRGKR
jgi:hypothetical protein